MDTPLVQPRFLQEMLYRCDRQNAPRCLLSWSVNIAGGYPELGQVLRGTHFMHLDQRWDLIMIYDPSTRELYIEISSPLAICVGIEYKSQLGNWLAT